MVTCIIPNRSSRNEPHDVGKCSSRPLGFKILFKFSFIVVATQYLYQVEFPKNSSGGDIDFAFLLALNKPLEIENCLPSSFGDAYYWKSVHLNDTTVQQPLQKLIEQNFTSNPSGYLKVGLGISMLHLMAVCPLRSSCPIKILKLTSDPSIMEKTRSDNNRVLGRIENCQGT